MSARTPRWAAVAALLVLVVCGAMRDVAAQGTSITSPVIINYATGSEPVVYEGTTSKAFASANAQCMANGMNVIGGETTTRLLAVYTAVSAKFAGALNYSTYSAMSAQPTATNTKCSFTDVNYGASQAGKHPVFCVFSIQWGLFSQVVNDGDLGGQPGLMMYRGAFKYYNDGVNALGTATLYWTNKFDTDTVNPNGYPSTVINTKTSQDNVRFINVPSVYSATTGFNIDAAKFITVCEAQVSAAAPPQTFPYTQPAFILGYKEWTWAQAHWWVIFLIVAVILLIVLFAILIFCCATSAPPKEEPPIAPMVLRERNGRAYVNASDDDEPPAKSRSLPAGQMSAPQMPPPQQQPNMGMMMMPVPMVDPEDLIQATPSIYSQDAVMQTADGDSMASDEEEEFSDEEEH